MPRKTATATDVKCQGDYCTAKASHTLVNGSEITQLCEHCLQEQLGEMAMQNEHFSSDWILETKTVTVG